jgi:outer membrane protein W
MFKRVLRSLAFLAGASFFSTIALAGGAEVSGFGGGITMDGGTGTHAALGGGAAYLLGDNVHLFGEFSYATLASASMSSGTTTANASAKLASFGGGADYSFGSSSSKLRPYVLAALGVGHFYGTASADGFSATVGIANDLYTAVGGGVRLYLTKRWGLKPEVRYQRYESSQSSLLGGGIGSSNSLLYTVGVFYQFGH